MVDKDWGVTMLPLFNSWCHTRSRDIREIPESSEPRALCCAQAYIEASIARDRYDRICRLRNKSADQGRAAVGSAHAARSIAAPLPSIAR
jgi:hypothetical protein